MYSHCVTNFGQWNPAESLIVLDPSRTNALVLVGSNSLLFSLNYSLEQLIELGSE